QRWSLDPSESVIESRQNVFYFDEAWSHPASHCSSQVAIVAVQRTSESPPQLPESATYDVVGGLLENFHEPVSERLLFGFIKWKCFRMLERSHFSRRKKFLYSFYSSSCNFSSSSAYCAPRFQGRTSILRVLGRGSITMLESLCHEHRLQLLIRQRLSEQTRIAMSLSQ